VALVSVSVSSGSTLVIFPEVPELFYSDTVVVVKDSKEGWAKAFRQLLALLWAGEIPQWDIGLVRPCRC
jgi:ribonucleoside-diphosphate reductase alpha chain